MSMGSMFQMGKTQSIFIATSHDTKRPQGELKGQGPIVLKMHKTMRGLIVPQESGPIVPHGSDWPVALPMPKVRGHAVPQVSEPIAPKGCGPIAIPVHQIHAFLAKDRYVGQLMKSMYGLIKK